MSWLSKKNIRKWLRILHRDIGFFIVGITLVYAVSGIILNHKKLHNDPAYRTVVVENKIPVGLTIGELELFFANCFDAYVLNKVLPDNEQYQLFIKGGIGSYNPNTGLLQFEVYKKKPLVFFINKLHYNQKKYWTAPADVFGGILIFLALSGIFMVRGKKGILGRGKCYLMAGFVFVLLYIWL
ncbi:MAG TPA: hypothetical protein VJY41_07930 [Prolixibacteraceae bacterium]|nr:hypothetical protein [Prolixibacteraceae bacterium]